MIALPRADGRLRSWRQAPACRLNRPDRRRVRGCHPKGRSEAQEARSALTDPHPSSTRDAAQNAKSLGQQPRVTFPLNQNKIIKPHLGPRPYFNWELRRMQSTTDGGATLGRFTKTVVPDPPYVVWVVQTGGARYRVDARTGAILGKELPPPRGDLY